MTPLDRARARVAHLESRLAKAIARSEALTGTDPAVVSGVRRKPSRRADARRFAAYDRESSLHVELAEARRALATLERARDAAEELSRRSLDLSALSSARFVRTRRGWQKVVRVNAKSVTVATPYSWTERVALDAVLEVQP